MKTVLPNGMEIVSYFNIVIKDGAYYIMVYNIENIRCHWDINYGWLIMGRWEYLFSTE